MTSPASRVEVQKLAYELGVHPRELAYLEPLPATELMTLRRGVSQAMFAVSGERLEPVGALARRVPATLAARVAKAALGPLLSGRVASVMDPGTAVALAAHLEAEFLAEVTLSLDPSRAAAIIKELDDELVVAVGQQLLERGEYIVLSRFITVVHDDVVMPLVDLADGAQLLEVALYAEDHTRVDELLAGLPDGKVASIIEAATTDAVRADEAVSLITLLNRDSQRRLAHLAASLDPAVADAVVAATARLQVWPQLLPVVGSLSDEAIGCFVNAPTLLDPGLVDALVVAVRTAGESGDEPALPFGVLLGMLSAADEAHVAMLGSVSQLDDPATLAWAADSLGIGADRVSAAVSALRAGEPLPDDVLAALPS